MPKPQKMCLETNLRHFLEIGHLEQKLSELERWLNNLHIPITTDPTTIEDIKTWPVFIQTLVALIKNL